MEKFKLAVVAFMFVAPAFADTINPDGKKWTHLPDGRWMFVDPPNSNSKACDFEHQCYNMDPLAPNSNPPPPVAKTHELEPAPRAQVEPLPFIQELPPPPEDDMQSCFNLRRGLFATAQAAAMARAKCGGYYGQ